MVDAHSHVFVFFAESSSSGPAGHAWYGLLDRVFKPSASLGGLIKSVSVDQLGFAPIILGTFFTYLCVLEGKGAEATRLKLSQDLPPTVVSPKISLPVHSETLTWSVD